MSNKELQEAKDSLTVAPEDLEQRYPLREEDLLSGQQLSDAVRKVIDASKKATPRSGDSEVFTTSLMMPDRNLPAEIRDLEAEINMRLYYALNLDPALARAGAEDEQPTPESETGLMAPHAPLEENVADPSQP